MLTRSYRLRAGAEVREGVVVHLVSPAGGLSLGVLTDDQCDYLNRLVTEDCAPEHPALFVELLRRQWLRITLSEKDYKLVTLRPVRARPRTFPRGEGRLMLSRFAVLRRDNDVVLLESPRSGFAAEVHDISVLGLFARPRDRDELSEGDWALAKELLECGLLVTEDSAEETEFDLLAWRPHELWFHVRSRGGLLDEPSGGTFWARGRYEPLPVRTGTFGTTTPLSTPDLEQVRRNDPKLTDVLEDRRSVRRHGQEPLTADQLAEFLYRTARTRKTWSDKELELADRPYPSGGALHELEIYPVVTDVRGVEPGLHHYDSHRHRLELVAGMTDPVRALAGRAAAAARMSGTPQLVFVITARFGRLMWKYQSMAYALTLKHTGVLFASMYHVATAMGLAPCALGCGDSDLFAQASGLDWIVESSVGEFLLGSEGIARQ